VERASGTELDPYFQENICKPLGIKDLGFWITLSMQEKLSAMHLRDADGSLKEIPQPTLAGVEPGAKVRCLGGGGSFGTVEGYASKDLILLELRFYRL
jgi:methyl acetate hydrolase